MQNQQGATTPNKDISSPAVNQMIAQVGYKDVFYQLEQAIGADVQKVLQLVQNGIISNEQGQYLMRNLAGQAQKINNYKNTLMQQQTAQNSMPQSKQMQTSIETQNPQLTPMEMFNQEFPGFFDGEGRSDVLTYLKGYEMDKDEIIQISKLIENLENSAVNKYLKKSNYEKSLKDENAQAKSRLKAYAQNCVPEDKNGKIFSREDIGRMSGEEFTKNEKLIMDQLRQGLIK